jgi:hypothetical protein
MAETEYTIEPHAIVVQKIQEFSLASECNETVLSGLTDSLTFGPMSLRSKESTG